MLLFGCQKEHTFKRLESILEKDLDCSLSPHSLFKRLSIPTCPVPVPLMICGSTDDIIVEPDALQGWQPYLMEGVDAERLVARHRLWKCPQGRHFFHFFLPTVVGNQIQDFWQSLRHLDTVYSSLKV